jgi:hypothetical protein
MHHGVLGVCASTAIAVGTLVVITYRSGEVTMGLDVLVVDSCAERRGTYVERLEALGWSVQSTGSAVEALRLLAGGGPALVLTYSSVDGHSFHEFAEAIKRVRPEAELVVYFDPARPEGPKGLDDPYVDDWFPSWDAGAMAASLVGRLSGKASA